MNRGHGHVADDLDTYCGAHYGFGKRQSSLPQRADIRRSFLSVEDQGSTNACVGYAAGAAIEAVSETKARISKIALYTQARSAESPKPSALTDDGCSPSLLLANIGGCIVPDNVWPNKEKTINQRIPLDVYQAGDGYDVRYFRIGAKGPARSKAIQSALHLGTPVIFAMAFGEKYERLEANQNYQGLQGDTAHGSHMQVLTGYDAALGLFYARNSWGTGWANGGYCAITAACIQSDECLDFYVINAATVPI